MGNLIIINVEENSEINAKSKIKTSDFYLNKEFEFLRPLFDNVLQDEDRKENIEQVIHSILGTESDIVTTAVINNPEVEKLPEPKSEGTYLLKDIEKIENIGLLKVIPEDKIIFDKNLTIIYGKNGSGKSTLYKSLCNLFGYPKKCTKKLKSNETGGIITATINEGGSEKKVNWNFDKDNQAVSKVKIFDSRTSQAIILSEQDNKFQLSHLGTEYFAKIYSAVNEFVTDLKQSWQSKEGLLKSLEEKVAHFKINFGDIPTQKTLENENCSYTEEDELKLIEIKTQIQELQTTSIETITQKYQTSKAQANKLFDISIDRDDQISLSPNFNTARLKRINDLLKSFTTKKLELKEISITKNGTIPQSWLENPAWESFIKSSILFASELSSSDQDKFTKEECLYCHQKLISEESKKLLLSYKLLSENIENELRRTREEIVADKDFILGQIEALKYFQTQFVEKLSEDDLENIKKNLLIYGNIVARIDSAQQIIFEDGTWDKLANTYSKLSEIFRLLYRDYRIKFTQLSEKQRTIETLTLSVADLEKKKAISNLKTDFLDFYKLKDLENTVLNTYSTITKLKIAISKEQGEFEKSSIQNQFNKFLDEEYEKMYFKPPDGFALKFNISEAVSQRHYIADQETLLDIFSEGEQKLHSLADFFAEAKAQEFKGIYIFDDPVNSLDEGNIKSIATRIAELCQEGNQIIVFTHNLIFLNELVDTTRKGFIELEKFRGIIYYTAYDKIPERFEKRGKQIDKLIKTLDAQDLSESMKEGIANSYDLISGYLEMYLEEKLLKNTINRYRRNISMQKLPELAEKLKYERFRKLYSLYDITSGKGNRHATVSGNLEYEGDLDRLKTDWENVKKYIEEV